MSKFLKDWLIWTSICAATVAIIGFFDRRYALGLIWTYFHAETSTWYWMKIGLNWGAATVIACGVGCFSLFGWVWMSNRSIDVIKTAIFRLKRWSILIILPVIAILLADGKKFRAVAILMIFVIFIAAISYLLKEITLPKASFIVKKLPYFAVFLGSLTPDGGVFAGIAVIDIFNLNRCVAVPILMIGNIIKIVLCAAGINLLNIVGR